MDKVYSVTSIPPSPAEEQARRIKFYVWNMGVRMLLMGIAVFIPVLWIQITLIGISLILPLVAVIGANEANTNALKYDKIESAFQLEASNADKG